MIIEILLLLLLVSILLNLHFYFKLMLHKMHDDLELWLDFGNADALAKCIQKSENISNEEYLILANNARNFAEINCAPEVHYNALINIYKDSILNF